jgi:hypothetical protein
MPQLSAAQIKELLAALDQLSSSSVTLSDRETLEDALSRAKAYNKLLRQASEIQNIFDSKSNIQDNNGVKTKYYALVDLINTTDYSEKAKSMLLLRLNELSAPQLILRHTQLSDELVQALQLQKELPKQLPEQASQLYAERSKKSESIIDFLRRVYRKEMDAGILTRPAFRRLDPPGEMALRNWLRENELPEDIRILRKSESLPKSEGHEPTEAEVRDAQRHAKRLERLLKKGRSDTQIG